MPTRQTYRHRSRDGNSTSPTGVREDLPQEEEGDPHPAHQGRCQAVEAVEAAEAAGAAEAVEAEGEEEHSHSPEVRHPNQPRNS